MRFSLVSWFVVIECRTGNGNFKVRRRREAGDDPAGRPSPRQAQKTTTTPKLSEIPAKIPTGPEKAGNGLFNCSCALHGRRKPEAEAGAVTVRLSALTVEFRILGGWGPCLISQGICPSRRPPRIAIPSGFLEASVPHGTPSVVASTGYSLRVQFTGTARVWTPTAMTKSRDTYALRGQVRLSRSARHDA